MKNDIGCYDMKYDEFKQICCKTWKETFNYLCIDKARNKKEGKYRFSKKVQTHILNGYLKVKVFSFLNVGSN